ncbi:alpha/beta-hydrolase [Rhizoclosmatium globosum]|uniref:Alpha/beta-hydrolase n=1 Tax=Rhizoclosmatium globosum TaxID=329046 RepID=A0A1Y2BKR8_9FUNG|nr:alpha/beta-hydrolase [Rhizoclosmatium globosum]|eukprot:ORY35220.1 alpha/beta-hydrolase [Rhizoclosmatium globosum]
MLSVFTLFIALASAQTVTLDYATIQGSTQDTVASFLGIPYAAPPVGPLRFKPPQPPLKASTLIQATSFGSSCIPISGPATGFSEDCLTINVWAPLESSSSPLPVVVWIYGGYFTEGSSASPIYNGTNFIQGAPEGKRPIVVTFNYRLGYFGFLASEDLRKEGSLNAGLLDQKAAFEWVQKYIAKFGGDPARVTAWGESAGARSVHFHMAAKLSPSPLFQQAIMESGSVNLNTGFVANFQSYYNTLASNLNCPSSGVLACLRNASASALATAATSLPTLYLPVVDGVYLVKPPLLTVYSGNAQNIPIIWMYNTNEGTLFSALFKAYPSPSAALSFEATQFSFLNASALNQVQVLYPPSAYQSVGPYQPYFEAAADALGDAFYVCPIHTSAVAASSAQNSSLIYRARFNIIPSLLASSALQNLGVFHSAELQFVWNYKTLLTPSDQKVAQALIAAYTNFIFGGAPDASTSVGFKWPPFNNGGQVVVIDEGLSGVLETVGADTLTKCKFWNDGGVLFAQTNPPTATTSATKITKVHWIILVAAFLLLHV